VGVSILASPIDEGWTRFVLDTFEFPYTLLHDHDIRAKPPPALDAVIVPDLSRKEIVEGSPRMKEAGRASRFPYTGGLGEKGVRALEEFVRAGGTLITLGNACELAIQDLHVPVTNTVSKVSRREFDTRTLLRVTMDTQHPLGFGMPSRRWCTTPPTPSWPPRFRARECIAPVVARYGEGKTLVASGWARAPRSWSGKQPWWSRPWARARACSFGFRPSIADRPTEPTGSRSTRSWMRRRGDSGSGRWLPGHGRGVGGVQAET
jgi:hypothetical protein